MTTLECSRLNYIGSKHTLIDWLFKTILEQTGLSSFQGKSVADLFSGTGVVSFNLRAQGANVLSNDIEPCSYVVTKAMTECHYTADLQKTVNKLNDEIQRGLHGETVGFITRNYSPYETCERMFFTVENAKRMDYIRKRIEEYDDHDKTFLLASLLISADAVANCASVYGAYLKQFKKTAEKLLILTPIHTLVLSTQSKTVCKNVLNNDFLQSIHSEIVYLDPPYNERQYSKNYFPLSVLTFPPDEQESFHLTGKTGIPFGLCFTSPFCSKKTVKQSFQTLIQGLKAKWIFLSYNSESLVPRDELVQLLQNYGTVTVVERPYKRFKSQAKETKQEIKEYLFCLKRE